MLYPRGFAIVAAVFFVMLTAPTLLWGQNSELPLQPGQVQQEEIEKLVGVLESDAEVFDKAIACKRLAVIGTEDAVEALAELLSDETLAHYARYALEPIPDPSVDKALHDALGKLKGKQLIGVINSIGNRQDPKALPGLTKLLADPDPQVAAAAAAAIGRNTRPQASGALEQALGSAPPAVRPEPCRFRASMGA